MPVSCDPVPLQTLLLDDGLAHAACIGAAGCRARVGALRRTLGANRRSATDVVPFIPGEVEALPDVVKQVGVYAAAGIDLSGFRTADDIAAAMATVATRHTLDAPIRRARRKGYTVRGFDPLNHADDLVAVHRSKTWRDRKPVAGEFYTADASGLHALLRDVASACPIHRDAFVGIFHGGRLVGYLCLRRIGNAAFYRRFMGHGAHQRDGIMALLHESALRSLVDDQPNGPRYVMYGAYARRPLDPPTQWKRRALFKPHYVIATDHHHLSLPATPPLPGLGEGLVALKQTVGEPWPQALETAAHLGVPQVWCETLHRALVIEATRAPGLTTQLLRSGPCPPPDVLRPLAPRLFPLEALAGAASAAVLLRGDDRGLDTLLPLHDAGMANVHVIHGDGAMREVLRKTYSPAWTYAADMTGALADLWIIETPPSGVEGFLQRHFARVQPSARIILSVSEAGLLALDCPEGAPDQIAARLSALAGRRLTCNAVSLRHATPDETHWVWLEHAR
jgi:hypothetical protein